MRRPRWPRVGGPPIAVVPAEVADAPPGVFLRVRAARNGWYFTVWASRGIFNRRSPALAAEEQHRQRRRVINDRRRADSGRPARRPGPMIGS